MGPIIGIAFPKSSGILGILRAPGAGGLQAAGQHTQPIVGKSKPERKRQCSRGPCRADNFQGPACARERPARFTPGSKVGDPCRIRQVSQAEKRVQNKCHYHKAETPGGKHGGDRPAKEQKARWE